MSTEPKPYFRTTELGDIPYPSGTMRFITVKSPALNARADLSLYIPKQAAALPHVPVVILLHGVYGSHWCWNLKGEAHLTLQNMIDEEAIPPMILATPSDGLWGDGSGYIPHTAKDFEQWIVQDVPQAVHEATDNALNAPHFIGGLSMGGFGALRLGAKYSDRFSAFAGHSSITNIDQMPLFVEDPLAAYPQDASNPASVLEAMLKNQKNLRPFRFDCGADDILIEQNRALEKALNDAGIAHEYQEHPGGHEWPYWTEHVRETFSFFAQQI